MAAVKVDLDKLDEELGHDLIDCRYCYECERLATWDEASAQWSPCAQCGGKPEPFTYRQLYKRTRRQAAELICEIRGLERQLPGGDLANAMEEHSRAVLAALQCAKAHQEKLEAVAQAARELRAANLAMEEAVCGGFDQSRHAGIHGEQYLAERELDAALAALEASDVLR